MAVGVFRALSSPQRLRALERLAGNARGEGGAGEIMAAMDCAQSTTAQHIAVLVRAGLITADMKRRPRVYRLEREVLRRAAAELLRLAGPG